MEDERGSLISRNKGKNINNYSYLGVEMKSFSLCLEWVYVDQSNIWRTGLSWSIFLLLTIGSPLVSHFLLLCSTCDKNHHRPYDEIVQVSLSVSATVSFLSLSCWSRKYGLNRFLFLDKLSDESEKVRQGYAAQLRRSMKLLCIFVLPCFGIECAYKIWWYVTGASEIPYFYKMYASHIIVCTLQLCSWLYRISIYILACILYQLICYLHLLKMEDFVQFFQKETEVVSILQEHLRIRRNLRIISHRYRAFILLSLLLVTASQFTSLLTTTRSSAQNNIFEAGELALCSICLVTGLFICLRSATKITHRAQSITSLAARWHVCATINSYDDLDNETPTTQITASTVYPVTDDWESDEEIDGDDLDNTKIYPIYAQTISCQKRQALVTYLENNRAGITVFGFMLDRTWLHTIFGIELCLLLWLLNKTIGISHP